MSDEPQTAQKKGAPAPKKTERALWLRMLTAGSTQSPRGVISWKQGQPLNVDEGELDHIDPESFTALGGEPDDFEHWQKHGKPPREQSKKKGSIAP